MHLFFEYCFPARLTELYFQVFCIKFYKFDLKFTERAFKEGSGMSIFQLSKNMCNSH